MLAKTETDMPGIDNNNTKIIIAGEDLLKEVDIKMSKLGFFTKVNIN